MLSRQVHNIMYRYPGIARVYSVQSDQLSHLLHNHQSLNRYSLFIALSISCIAWYHPLAIAADQKINYSIKSMTSALCVLWLRILTRLTQRANQMAHLEPHCLDQQRPGCHMATVAFPWTVSTAQRSKSRPCVPSFAMLKWRCHLKEYSDQVTDH